MNKGGYQIVDLLNHDLSVDDGANIYTIKGIYNLIEKSIKPIYLSGILVRGIEQQDRFVIPTINSSGQIEIRTPTTGGIEEIMLTIDVDDTINCTVA